MTEFCGVHLTTKDNGICRWCVMFDGMDGRDDKLLKHYDKKTGLVAKPSPQDEQIANYEDPWAVAFFQPYMDFQAAYSPHTLEQYEVRRLLEYWYYEWGLMLVRGERASAVVQDPIGYVVIGFDKEGCPTLALVDSPDQPTVPDTRTQ